MTNLCQKPRDRIHANITKWQICVKNLETGSTQMYTNGKFVSETSRQDPLKCTQMTILCQNPRDRIHSNVLKWQICVKNLETGSTQIYQNDKFVSKTSRQWSIVIPSAHFWSQVILSAHYFHILNTCYVIPGANVNDVGILHCTWCKCQCKCHTINNCVLSSSTLFTR